MPINILQRRITPLGEGELAGERWYNAVAACIANMTSDTLTISISNGSLRMEKGGQTSGLPVELIVPGAMPAIASAARYNTLAGLFRNIQSQTLCVGLNARGGLQIEQRSGGSGVIAQFTSLARKIPVLADNALPGPEHWNAIVRLLLNISSSTMEISINARGGLRIELNEEDSSESSSSGSSSSSSVSSSSSSSASSSSSSSAAPIYVPVEVVAVVEQPSELYAEELACQSYNRFDRPYPPSLEYDGRTTEYTLYMSSQDYQAGDAFAVGYYWESGALHPYSHDIDVTCCGTYCGTYTITDNGWQYVALVEIAADGTIRVTPYPTPSPTPFPT